MLTTSKFKVGEIIITRSKHVLIVLDSRKTKAHDSCCECFFNYREYGCAYYRERDLIIDKNIACKYGFKTLLPHSYCYFKEIKEGL